MQPWWTLVVPMPQSQDDVNVSLPSLVTLLVARDVNESCVLSQLQHEVSIPALEQFVTDMTHIGRLPLQK